MSIKGKEEEEKNGTTFIVIGNVFVLSVYIVGILTYHAEHLALRFDLVELRVPCAADDDLVAVVRLEADGDVGESDPATKRAHLRVRGQCLFRNIAHDPLDCGWRVGVGRRAGVGQNLSHAGLRRPGEVQAFGGNCKTKRKMVT